MGNQTTSARVPAIGKPDQYDVSSTEGRIEFLSAHMETLENVVGIFAYSRKIPFADKMEWSQELYLRLLEDGSYLKNYDQTRPLRPFLLTIFGRILATILGGDPTRITKLPENTVEITSVTDCDGTREYRRWKPGRSGAEMSVVTDVFGHGATLCDWQRQDETRVSERMLELDRQILDAVGEISRKYLGERHEQVFYLTRMERSNTVIGEEMGLLATEVQDMRLVVMEMVKGVRISGLRLADYRQQEYERVVAEEMVREIEFHTAHILGYSPCCGMPFSPESDQNPWEITVPAGWVAVNQQDLVKQLTWSPREGYDPRYNDMNEDEVTSMEIFEMLGSEHRNPWDWLKHARRAGKIRVVRTNGRTGACIRYYYCRKSAEQLVAREQDARAAKLLEQRAAEMIREAEDWK